MFKSCCAGKKISKSKSKSENMESISESATKQTKEKFADTVVGGTELPVKDESTLNEKQVLCTENVDIKEITSSDGLETDRSDNSGRVVPIKVAFDDSANEAGGDTLDLVLAKVDLMKKRYSVDYKSSRMNFKRFSVDCRPDAATLEELARLEQELARTNVDVPARPGRRRKSTGILKSTTGSNNDLSEQRPATRQEIICSDDDDVFEKSTTTGEVGHGDPPATPVGRDELALRRHRFFSDLVCAARAAVEHRVRFDPLGPVVADQGSEADPSAAGQCPAADLESLIERLERVTSRLERLPLLRARTPPRSPAPSPTLAPSPPPLNFAEVVESDNMSVNGYQEIIQGPLRTYLELSKQIGGDVAAHANLVNAAFQAQLRYIQLATTRSKPSQAEEMQLLAPTSEQISAIQQFREKNRASALFNHLSAVSESIPALGWVAVAPAPSPYVKEMNDAGQFYTNRVLKEWKEKDKKHAEWCRTWVQLLADLQAYVKQYHTTGLVWSGKGAGAPPPPPPGGMPPPPPALPDVDFSNLSIDDRSALFAEINQGEAITSSLKRVTADMQTHKNPQLRQGPAPFKPAGGARTGAGGKPLPQPGAGTLPDKPPVFVRDGKKWLIEYQKGNSNLLVENAEMNNVVYMFRCRDSALTVKGKINGVVLDSCTKCSVVFDNLVSSVEFVNCQSVQMQVLGKVPTISIDKTDGCQIYLSPESLDVEIVSSKSSEMNVLVPKSNGDYAEHPIPEQFKTMLNKPPTGLTTTPVESTG